MGKLIDDLISQVLAQIDQKTLHIKRISKGFRFTGTMLQDGSCGLCFSVFNQDPLDSCEYIRSVRSLEDLDIKKLLKFASNKENDLERVIGISVLNAVSQHILNQTQEKYQIIFDTDPLDHISFRETDLVVMIGYIGAFLPKLQGKVKNIAVIDDRLRDINLIRTKEYIKSPESTQEYLRAADIALITGSSLATATLETLLGWIQNAREVAVVGPSAGFIPEPLFSRGVSIVGGMKILEPQKVLDIIAVGEGTPHFKRYCRKYNIMR
ncbi:MAG: Rossmann-like domain-containing protein [Candidatus Helarchaeota archaeon]